MKEKSRHRDGLGLAEVDLGPPRRNSFILHRLKRTDGRNNRDLLTSFNMGLVTSGETKEPGPEGTTYCCQITQ